MEQDLEAGACRGAALNQAQSELNHRRDPHRHRFVQICFRYCPTPDTSLDAQAQSCSQQGSNRRPEVWQGAQGQANLLTQHG